MQHKERSIFDGHNGIRDDDETATFTHTNTKKFLDDTVDKHALNKCTENLAQTCANVEQIEVLACQNIKEISATLNLNKPVSEIGEPSCKLSPYDPSLFSVKVENVCLVQGPGDPAEIKSSTKAAESSSGHVPESEENRPDDEEGIHLSRSEVPDSNADAIPEGASAAEGLTYDGNPSRSAQKDENSSGEFKRPDNTTKDSGYVQFCERGRTPNCRATLAVLGFPESGKSYLIRNLLDKPSDSDQLPSNFYEKPSVFLAEANGTHRKLLDEPLNLQLVDAKAEKSMTGNDVATELTGEELTNPSDGHNGFTDQPAILKIIEIDGLPVVFGSSIVYLIVLDITKDLDEKLPDNGGIIGETTQKQYLDDVLDIICTFTERTVAPDQELPVRSVIIALTGIDALDLQTSEADIQAFTKKVLDHLKGQYTCKYVENKIFAISSKGRNEDDLVQLKELIMTLCKSKDTFAAPVPTS